MNPAFVKLYFKQASFWLRGGGNWCGAVHPCHPFWGGLQAFSRWAVGTSSKNCWNHLLLFLSEQQIGLNVESRQNLRVLRSEAFNSSPVEGRSQTTVLWSWSAEDERQATWTGHQESPSGGIENRNHGFCWRGLRCSWGYRSPQIHVCKTISGVCVANSKGGMSQWCMELSEGQRLVPHGGLPGGGRECVWASKKSEVWVIPRTGWQGIWAGVKGPVDSEGE